MKSGEIILFCLAFLSQILLINGVHARRVIRNRRYVLDNFPPATHPKMYPQPLDYYEGKLRNFIRLNVAIVAVGLLIILGILGSLAGIWAGGIFDPAQDQRWDVTIVAPFFILQVLSSQYLDFAFKHGVAMATATPPRVRTTELRRRQLNDFVSPGALTVLLLVNAAFVAFLLYYRGYGFPWFTAAGNIAGAMCMLTVFALSLAFALFSSRPDPYQRTQDHRESLKSVVRYTFWSCIAVPVLLTAILLFKAWDPDAYEPAVVSLFCQAFALPLLWSTFRYRVENIDFDVYREDARTT